MQQFLFLFPWSVFEAEKDPATNVVCNGLSPVLMVVFPSAFQIAYRCICPGHWS